MRKGTVSATSFNLGTLSSAGKGLASGVVRCILEHGVAKKFKLLL